MKKLNLPEEIVMFGAQVKSFPVGIGEAFDDLAKRIPHGRERDYYGISWMEGNDVLYYAMTAEKFAGESVQYDYQIMSIEKGDYCIVKVKDWQSKTATIKDVFHDMMNDPQTDNSKPCIEWYKSYDELLCMIKSI